MNDPSPFDQAVCDDLCRAIEERMDGEPASHTDEAIASHLSRCADCREFQADLLGLRDGLRTLPLIPLPDEATADVLARTVGVRPRDPISSWVRRGYGSMAAAAAVALAIGLSGLLVGRSDVASPAQLKRATAQTYYVLKLTSGVLRQVKHVTVHEVLEGHMTTAFKRFTTEWSSLYPTTIRRSGT